MHAKSGLAVAAVVCLALGACGPKQPTGQVAATIKGKEITNVDLRNELNGFVAPNPQIRKAAEEQALNAIIARKVLAQAAEKAGVGKTPEFAQQQQRLHETLLVQTWQAQIAKQIPAPSREEAEKFIAANPDLYAQHKIFDVEQLRFPRPTDPALIEAFKPLKTLEEVAALLNSHNIPNRAGQDAIDSLAVDPRVVEQILKMPPDEVFIIPAGNLLVANHIRQTRIVPFVGEPAIKQATDRLKAQRTQQAIQRQFGAILAAAKKDVVYSKAYEPAKSTPKAAPAATPPAPAK